MNEGTLIDPNLHKDNYDDDILPIINHEKKGKKVKKQTRKDEKVLDSDEEDDDIEPKKTFGEKDYFGILISAFISAFIGYFIYVNKPVVDFYGGMIPGFFSENNVTFKGRVIQIGLVIALQCILILWIL